MICPKCGSDDLRVLKTDKGAAIDIRVRSCRRCHFVFRTQEKPVLVEFSKEEVKEYERFVAQEATKEQSK